MKVSDILRKRLLQQAILLVLCGVILQTSIFSAASAAAIPLQWYAFEMANDQNEEAPEPAEKEASKATDDQAGPKPAKPPEANRPTPDRKNGTEKSAKEAIETPLSFKERVQAILHGEQIGGAKPAELAKVKGDDISRQIAAIQKRREEDKRILAELLKKQEIQKKQEQERLRREQAERERKQAQDVKANEKSFGFLDEFKIQQSKMLAKQNELMITLMQTIKEQQEELKKQSEQLAAQKSRLDELGKYKETLTISPPAAPAVDIPIQRISLHPSDALTFEFVANSTYQIYCRPNFETDIQLANEQIVDVVAGDSLRWSIRAVKDSTGTHVYVKPLQLGLETNLIITTNRRSYQIRMKAETRFNPIVNWTYPYNMDSEFSKNALPLQVESVKQLKFNYQISQGHSWKPDFVFDDGFRTYIHMPDNAKKKSPVIFLKNSDATMLLANYTIKNGSYVVDCIFDEAQLRVGNDIIKIKREKS